MIHFATIGTNWISEKFVQAAHETGLLKLNAIYSRTPETAQQFATPFGVESVFDDLTALANSDLIEAVYIASPNSLHCQQAILMMNHGKHVICEKPLASNIDEAQMMFEAAEKNGVVLLEAYKTGYLPNFKVIKDKLASIGKIHKAHFNYCQYSSRYQKYLDGLNPNTFNPDFSNGSIVDIGYYCVAAAVSLFGEPQSIVAQAHLLDSGVDAHGCVIFKYPQFSLQISHSKVTDSYADSEIQGEEGVILIEHIAECPGFTIKHRNGEQQQISLSQHENTMYYEAKAFAEHIQQGTPYSNQHALTVARILTEIRRQTGVVFAADGVNGAQS